MSRPEPAPDGGASPARFDAEVREHDARLAAAGCALWVGAEPTFTDRHSLDPAWGHQALGADKRERAEAMWCALAQARPGTLMLRPTGRRYPGEDEPRWCFGLLQRRDGAPLWRGPPDPALHAGAERPSIDLSAARLAVATAADAVLRPQGPGDPAIVTAECVGGVATLVVALPALPSVGGLLALVEAVERAANAHAVPALRWTGHAPPVDDTLALTTLTPDPAVIEISAAPWSGAADFLQHGRELYRAANAQGLSPYRLYYNGQVADSGGGGQITLGGSSPPSSPFVTDLRLLPRLVRFVNRHPCLSYLYAHEFVGSGGQSVRSDERGRDAFEELRLALSLLERPGPGSARGLWQSLAPFLCDAVGNSHRAEINIEKFANPHLPERGELGLVEFRGLRMQHRPERAAALACLLRAIVAMLQRCDAAPALCDWGPALHDRFALPWYLEQDLLAVLQTLDEAGLGLGRALQAELLRDEFRCIGRVELSGAELELRRGVEFWPLLGDAAGPEQGGTSRLVDASTARVELRLRAAPGWSVRIDGLVLPMTPEHDRRTGPGDGGGWRVFGVRYRSFFPAWGLHPMLPNQAPLTLTLGAPDAAQDWLVTLHEWRPDGQAYDGVPADLADAQRRRSERLEVAPLPRTAPMWPRDDEPGLSAHCLDLRYRARTP